AFGLDAATDGDTSGIVGGSVSIGAFDIDRPPPATVSTSASFEAVPWVEYAQMPNTSSNAPASNGRTRPQRTRATVIPASPPPRTGAGGGLIALIGNPHGSSWGWVCTFIAAFVNCCMSRVPGLGAALERAGSTSRGFASY